MGLQSAERRRQGRCRLRMEEGVESGAGWLTKTSNSDAASVSGCHGGVGTSINGVGGLDMDRWSRGESGFSGGSGCLCW